MHGNRTYFGNSNKAKLMLPRSSSPVTVYVDADQIPCVVEEAFATIAWDDLEECKSVMRRDNDSLGSQVNESVADEQDFADYAFDLIADSPGTLESSFSPAGLVPFQGCIIPPLTPQHDFSQEVCPRYPSPAEGLPHAHDEALWRGLAHYHHRALEEALDTSSQLHLTVTKKKAEINSFQERNVHLRELASRAKHLASVLDTLMSGREPCRGATPSRHGSVTARNCKRPRSDEDCETASAPGLVDDIIRDISERCNAVLHRSAKEPKMDDTETVQMFGLFSGLQTSVATEKVSRGEGSESPLDTSFRTSVQEHSTIRTQAYPHGHSFTSRNPQGGYCFRWVPKQS
ncbi:multicilin [Hypomesus transpacificus]|uniref:multicilin n=1 Tax=Hypomesus transpacificus TaxID=137520 RepID=UPI001F080A8C|nr:multicilin [Hypomesus transpacificus]